MSHTSVFGLCINKIVKDPRAGDTAYFAFLAVNDYFRNRTQDYLQFTKHSKCHFHWWEH